MHRLTWSLIGCLLVFLTPVARADEVLVVVTGGIPPHEREIASGAARSAFRTRGHQPLRGEDILGEKAANDFAQCVRRGDSGCSRVLVARPVPRVFVLHLEEDTGPGRPLVLTGWLLDGATGDRLGGDRRYCERCGDEALGRTSEALVSALLGSEARPADGTRLDIRSTPPGARVTVDGEPVGVTNLVYGVRPGPHAVTMERDGYRVVGLNVVAPAGRITPVSVVLEPTGPPPGDRRRRVWGWSALLGGAALTGVGIVLVALDQPAVDDGRQQPEYRRTFWPGIAVGAAGALAAGVGVYLLVAPEKGGDPSRAASVGAGPRLAWGIQGRF